MLKKLLKNPDGHSSQHHTSVLSRARRALGSVLRIVKLTGGVGGTARKVWGIYQQSGIGGLRDKLKNVARSASSRNDYTKWVERYDTLTDQMRTQIRSKAAAMPHAPLISVVMPTYNPKPQWLAQAIESVQAQLYPHWELCIADDASTAPSIRALLEDFAQKDARIKLIFRQTNGHISEASNSALSLATGAWVALFDHDDLLAEHALYCVAQTLITHPKAQVIYSDEDKVNEAGTRSEPHFKSDWNPDLFFAQNYVSHLCLYRRDLIERVGGFRTGVEGSQDQDLLLRCLPHLQHGEIVHIPRVLYHWRTVQGSTAHLPSEKSYTSNAGIKALKDYFASQNKSVEITEGPAANTYRVHHLIPEPAPLVSLLIPTRDHRELTETCVRSILEKSTYTHYEILILDNGSIEPQTLEFFSQIQKEDARVRVLRYDHPFNYSAINNYGVSQAKGSIIGLVNNDIEVINAQWLGEMLSYAAMPDVGCVGAKLYYGNDTVQHAGVIISLGGVAGHSHKHFQKDQAGYFHRLLLPQTLSAVTAACLLVRREVYEQVGGLDEENLKIAFNDVDFCLKVREAGYRNIWTPFAELYHHESISRGSENTPEKQARFQKEVLFMHEKWGDSLKEDPYYNPNLSRYHEDFSLAWPPRVENIN